MADEYQTINTLTSTRREPVPFRVRKENDYSFSDAKPSTDDDNKLKVQLMEKDKIIFEYSKMLKETERVVENNKKLNNKKEEVISKLKDELRETKFRIKNLENLLRNQEEESEKFKEYAEEKILLCNKEKQLSEEKLEEMTRLFEHNQSDYQNTLIEYKKLEKHLNKLRNNFDDKKESMKSYEKQFEEIKKENKTIPSLKKQISDLDSYVGHLKGEISTEQKANDNLVKEKEEVEEKFKNYIRENNQEKDLNTKFIRLNYEMENLNREKKEKEKELQQLNDKLRISSKENDYFVEFVNKELNLIINTVEDFSQNSRRIFDQQYTKSNYTNLKFELVNKNFEILKSKLIENYNNTVSMMSKLEKNKSQIDDENMEVNSEKEKLLKENAVLKQKIKTLSERNDELSEDNQKINDTCKLLKENYAKVRNECDELRKKNQEITKEVEHFLISCINQLKEKFPDIESEKQNFDEATFNLSYTHKVLYYIEILVNDYNKILIKEKDTVDNVKVLEVQSRNLAQENELLKSRIERILENKEADLKKADYLKSEELKKQKEVLYEKIKSLTSLLEESNQMITIYDNENREIKEKLQKTEYNLKMLTNSHLELEKSVNVNSSSLQYENEETELKVANLLRELELKEIHIQSIDNMLKRKDEEIAKLKSGNDEQHEDYNNYTSRIKSEEDNSAHTFRSPMVRSTNISTNANYVSSANDFTENETKLNRLIGSYNNDEVNHSANSRKSKRVPGTIYSTKKKV